MKNTHDYTPEEILDALEMLKNEYNSAPLYALMHGVPQLVKNYRKLQLDHMTLDGQAIELMTENASLKSDVEETLQALTKANRAYADKVDKVDSEQLEKVVADLEAAEASIVARFPSREAAEAYFAELHEASVAISQPDGHADALDHLKEYGGGSD